MKPIELLWKYIRRHRTECFSLLHFLFFFFLVRTVGLLILEALLGLLLQEGVELAVLVPGLHGAVLEGDDGDDLTEVAVQALDLLHVVGVQLEGEALQVVQQLGLDDALRTRIRVSMSVMMSHTAIET